MKIKITNITEWSEDATLVRGDSSREGANAVEELVIKEREAKVESDEWNRSAEGRILPFDYVSESDDEDEAVDEALDAFAEEHCQYDYLKPTDCDYEVMP